MMVRAGYHHDFVTAACGLAPVLLLSLRYPENDIQGENKMPKALFVVRATVADDDGESWPGPRCWSQT
jgi:hypothetical protein